MARWRNDTANDLFEPTTGATFAAGGEFDLDDDVYGHVVGLTRLPDDEPKPKKAAKAASAPSGEEPTE